MRRAGYYELVASLNTNLREQGFNYVSYGNYTDIDLDKQSLFPYAHIVIPSGSTNTILSQVTFRIVVADKVDFQKEYINTKNELFDPTNTLDVHQDLMARAQAAFSRVDYNDGWDLVVPYGWDGFKENFTNLLAGWTFTVGFQMANLC